MLLKTNLHFHTNDDPTHRIDYSAEEGIDRASKLGFDVIALTCHGKVTFKEQYRSYASSKGILLISGIEINISEDGKDGRHLLILNCGNSAERIKTFKDLEQYRKEHPDIFVIAPHPFFPSLRGKQSLLEYTEKYLHLFDALEHSWFYSKTINRNIPAEKISKKMAIPLVATSDTHFFDFLDTDYCLINAEELSAGSLFKAIKKGAFKNVTRAKRPITEMAFTFGKFYLKNSH